MGFRGGVGALFSLFNFKSEWAQEMRRGSTFRFLSYLNLSLGTRKRWHFTDARELKADVYGLIIGKKEPRTLNLERVLIIVKENYLCHSVFILEFPAKKSGKRARPKIRCGQRPFSPEIPKRPYAIPPFFLPLHLWLYHHRPNTIVAQVFISLYSNAVCGDGVFSPLSMVPELVHALVGIPVGGGKVIRISHTELSFAREWIEQTRGCWKA